MKTHILLISLCTLIPASNNASSHETSSSSYREIVSTNTISSKDDSSSSQKQIISSNDNQNESSSSTWISPRLIDRQKIKDHPYNQKKESKNKEIYCKFLRYTSTYITLTGGILGIMIPMSHFLLVDPGFIIGNPGNENTPLIMAVSTFSSGLGGALTGATISKCLDKLYTSNE